MRVRHISILVLSITAAGCGPSEPSVAAAPPADTLVSEWTAGIVTEQRSIPGVAVLADVRVAAHPAYERTVFELAGDRVPGYHVEYIDRPVRECGSGEVVEIEGEGWLSVRMEPARAHDEGGRPTIGERRRRPALGLVRELVLVCDFEGRVEWVLGVASPEPYRVLELTDPPRLVVDVRSR